MKQNEETHCNMKQNKPLSSETAHNTTKTNMKQREEKYTVASKK